MTEPQSTQPDSRLTADRPDIWLRAIDLATGLTGYRYERKVPLPNGAIYACGGGYYTPPLTERQKQQQEERLKKEEEERKRREEEPTLEEIEEEIMEIDRRIESEEYATYVPQSDWYKKQDQAHRERKEWLKQRREKISTAPVVYVPEGAMEWLLHEVGHYVAATPAERLSPNYGLLGDDDPHSAEREWQAWAFEGIILAPFGPARTIAPPTQRDGVGFSATGPIADIYMRHTERQMAALRLTVDPWRALYSEWVRWSETTRGPQWMDVLN